MITLQGNQLCAENAHFRRTWRIAANGTLLPESFVLLASGYEWLSSHALPTDEAADAILTPCPPPSVVEAPSVCAELRVGGQTYLLQVFPEARGVRIQQKSPSSSRGTSDQGKRGQGEMVSGIEADPVATSHSPSASGETLALAPLHLRLTQVTLVDQTDHHNELVFESEWLLHTSERAWELAGCLFYIEDVLTGNGLIVLKEAPLPTVRPVSAPWDLQVAARERHITLATDGYATTVLAYTGGKLGRIAALQSYQRCLRPYVPSRDGLLVSNTWGDRNRDGRINAAFLTQEIEAGARLGVDVIQIDDGWQVGATSNSVRAKEQGGVWEGFYAATDRFWSVSPERFPDGLEPLVAAAKEHGLRFGLWFGPDSADDFANWQRDAATIVRLHQERGIDYIKIDGVKLRSELGETNLHAFFDQVLTETEGRVVFDLDVTAEARPGYLGMVRVGPLFVENRYTDWRRYWPHQTLRNLWKLAHHLDPVRLRLEWLNHARNQDKYENDPLAPSHYRPDSLFATVMLSSPLGWFESSQLPESYFAEAAPLIAAWKAHRTALFSGTIYPIGNAPDGVAWTGFVSVGASGTYLLAFRETSPEAHWSSPWPFPYVAGAFARLGGDGEARLDQGQLVVDLHDTHRFFFGFKAN